jgi:hypothetical protein
MLLKTNVDVEIMDDLTLAGHIYFTIRTKYAQSGQFIKD